MTYEDPRKVLARHGLKPKKAFSQNFLCSSHAVDAIADATVETPGHPVVELGPGCGTLTAALIARGASVVAIERDREMQAVLAAEFQDAPLRVIDGDAAQVDYPALARELGGPLRVAGNLPYAITGAILRGLIDNCEALHWAVVMIQREVGDRLLAKPGESNYGALTAFAENVFDIKRVVQVPRGAFHPPPKVDSTVLKLMPRETALTPHDALLEAVIRAAFQARRKTLRNALSALPMPEGHTSESLIRAAGFDPQIRGERLHVTDFGKIAALLR